MTPHIWTEQEVTLLRREYPDMLTRDLARWLALTPAQVYAKAKRLGLRKSEAFCANAKSGRLSGYQGAAFRFQAGHKPWNTGKKGLQIGGGSVATRFQPGIRRGTAARNYVPIGTEILRDGYWVRKLRDDGPMHRRFEFVHRLVWIEHHGPIPDGHVVTFRNGIRRDVSPENLELITRTELSRRNRALYPRELVSLMKLATRLRSTIDGKQ